MSEKPFLFAQYGTPAKWSQHAIITVHPLADEPDQLVQANLKPEQCGEVGLQWLHKYYLFFVNICSYQNPYTFAFNGVVFDVTNADEKYDGSINVRTDSFPLYRNTVEEILNKLAHWIDHNSNQLEAIYKLPPDPESKRRGQQVIDNIDLYSIE